MNQNVCGHPEENMTTSEDYEGKDWNATYC